MCGEREAASGEERSGPPPGACTALRPSPPRKAVFTSVTRGHMFLTSASKFNVEPNSGIFDVSPRKGQGVSQRETPEPISQTLCF